MNMFWDIQNHELVQALDNSGTIGRLTWFVRDRLEISLAVVTPSSADQGYVAAEAPSGYFPKFGIKAASGLTGGFLAYTGTWSLAGSGTTSRYAGQVNLATTALIAALSTSTKLDVFAEFTLQDVSGNNRDTTQNDLRIMPDVIRGDEDEPVALYAPIIEEFTCSNGLKCLRFRNSDGQIIREDGPTGAIIP